MRFLFTRLSDDISVKGVLQVDSVTQLPTRCRQASRVYQQRKQFMIKAG